MNEHVTLVHPDARDPSERAISSGFPVDLLNPSAGRSDRSPRENCRCGWPKWRTRARGPRTERGNGGRPTSSQLP